MLFLILVASMHCTGLPVLLGAWHSGMTKFVGQKGLGDKTSWNHFTMFLLERVITIRQHLAPFLLELSLQGMLK